MAKRRPLYGPGSRGGLSAGTSDNYDYLEKTESGAFRKKIEKVARLDMNPK